MPNSPGAWVLKTLLIVLFAGLPGRARAQQAPDGPLVAIERALASGEPGAALPHLRELIKAGRLFGRNPAAVVRQVNSAGRPDRMLASAGKLSEPSLVKPTATRLLPPQHRS